MNSVIDIIFANLSVISSQLNANYESLKQDFLKSEKINSENFKFEQFVLIVSILLSCLIILGYYKSSFKYSEKINNLEEKLENIEFDVYNLHKKMKTIKMEYVKKLIDQVLSEKEEEEEDEDEEQEEEEEEEEKEEEEEEEQKIEKKNKRYNLRNELILTRSSNKKF